MPTLKLGNDALLTLPTRITTPSIHIQKDGDHWYVPLFSGSKGAVVQSGDYNYTLGGLNVGIYRAAIGREEVVVIIDVFSNDSTTWILTSNGELYGCGSNSNGQQGSGNTNDVLTFTKRAENVKEVSCSDNTTWYIDTSNNLYGCGSNYYGQQGSGTSGSSTNVLTFTKRAENVKEVSCSDNTTWYIDTSNNLYGCGYGYNGQQGSGASGYSAAVKTFTKRASNVKTVSCTGSTTWYIDNNNNLYGCGNNEYGNQGSNNTSNVSVFTKRASNVKEFACSANTTWYVDNNGNLYGCGYGFEGQQGSGASGSSANVLTFTKRASNVKTVSCSQFTTWYIDNNNDLYGCGDNDSGQQGSGNASRVRTFTKRASNVKEVICPSSVTWYIDTSNNLYGCGNNYNGNQGSGNTSYVYTFTKRAENVKTVSCSGSVTWYIDNNNDLYGCGKNSTGNQGSGDTSNVLTFTKRDYKTK